MVAVDRDGADETCEVYGVTGVDVPHPVPTVRLPTPVLEFPSLRLPVSRPLPTPVAVVPVRPHPSTSPDSCTGVKD